MPNYKRYNESGMRMTDCCGACSTFMEDGRGNYDLCCKKCYERVSVGEGDGAEYNPKTKNYSVDFHGAA